MEHGTFTLNETNALIGRLGPEAARLIAQDAMTSTPNMPVKHGDLTLGQIEALLNRVLTGVAAEDHIKTIAVILRGELGIELKQMFCKLFDKNGRFIPFPGLQSSFCDPNPQYHFDQPPINYGGILGRIRRHLSVGLQVKAEAIPLPSAEEFRQRVLAILAKLQKNPATANALNDIWLPIALPQLPVSSKKKGGYGALLEQFIDGVASAYKEAYPKRTLHNCRQGTLAGNVGLVPNTRHERLIEAMAKGPVVGVALMPFQGFSIDACREVFGGHELSKQIPDWMMLGGGLDTATAYMAYAKELCRDNSTQIVRCPALKWRSISLRFQFYAGSSYALFGKADDLAGVCSGYSAAVFCLG